MTDLASVAVSAVMGGVVVQAANVWLFSSRLTKIETRLANIEEDLRQIGGFKIRKSAIANGGIT